MMNNRTITFRMPEGLYSSAVTAARSEEMSASEFIRVAVAERVARMKDEAVGEGVIGLRNRFRRDVAEAKDWVGLQHRLREQGLVLREAKGELVLMTWPVESHLVALDRLGVTRAELTVLYRAPFPAHGPKAKAPPLVLTRLMRPVRKAKSLPYLLMRPLRTAA